MDRAQPDRPQLRRRKGHRQPQRRPPRPDFRRAVILGLEDPQDWHDHLKGIIDSLKPGDYHERILSERIALLLWKMRRATLYELAVVAAAHATAREEVQVAVAYARGTLARDTREGTLPDVPEIAVLARKARMTLPEDPELARILRYESTLHRQYLQLLHELEAIQARRRGEPSPLARLDVNGPD